MSMSYQMRHHRVRDQRGKASDQSCWDCAEQAHDWATIHGHDGSDVWYDYMPLCRRCHAIYDEIGHSLRLTETDTYEIKRLLTQGVTQERIADQFGVSQATIWRIKYK